MLLHTAMSAIERGVLACRTPPHEFDIVLCDLRQPACYDATYWGPGRNDNYHCKIEKEIADVPIRYADGRVTPKFVIIHPGQMPRPPVGTFGSAEVFAAIARAGVPLILFLNKEWLQHVGYSSPNFSNALWRFERTKATKLETSSLMDQVLLAVQHAPELSLPLEFAIVNSGHSPGTSTRGRFNTRPLVTNAMSQIFGEVALIDRGAIWAMPQFLDNARFCVAVLDRFEAFLTVQSHLLSSRAPAPLESVAAAPMTAMRDVFISHASEDKAEIARPLAEALMKRGLSVWFDEYELTLGDRLRRKIEEGLKVSRYGVTILSENFLRKKWPQEELDALFALETETKKILPVWHRFSAADISRYAPLLADRIAVSTDIGVDAVADAIVRTAKRQ